MIVPAPVIVESAWLIDRELGNTAEAGFIAAIGRGELHIENMQPVDYQRAAELLTTYNNRVPAQPTTPINPRALPQEPGLARPVGQLGRDSCH